MGETPKRLISGVLIASLYVTSFSYNGWYNVLLYIVVLAFVLTGLSEFYTITKQSESLRPFFKTGLFSGFVTVTYVYLEVLRLSLLKAGETLPWGGGLAFFQLTFHGAIGCILFFLFAIFIKQLLSKTIEGTIYSVGATILGILYIAIPAVHLFLLQKIEYGIFYIWLVSVATVMSDAGGYFAGMYFGKHKVGLLASPNKSYEGYIGGLFIQLIFTHIFYLIAKNYFDVPVMSFIKLSALSIIIYLASIMGDLIESLIKRDMKVKDSGNTIPGHGGILDLIDALLITVPSAYYFLIVSEHLKTL